jgi:predicted ATPase
VTGHPSHVVGRHLLLTGPGHWPRQQAASLELRAAMNLARLWQQQGKKSEA